MYISIPLPIRVPTSFCVQLHDLPLLTLQPEIERKSGLRVLFFSLTSIVRFELVLYPTREGPSNERGQTLSLTPFHPLPPCVSSFISFQRCLFSITHSYIRSSPSLPEFIMTLYKLFKANSTSAIVLMTK